MITDATDSDQFRELARRHLTRLRKERPDFYARHRREPRKLSGEMSGLGWTRTVYSHDIIHRALSELEPVEVAA